MTFQLFLYSEKEMLPDSSKLRKWVPLFLITILPNHVSGMYSGTAAKNGEYPSAVAILNNSEVVSGGVLVTYVHVFTACSVVGEVIDVDHGSPESSEEMNVSSTYNFRPYDADFVTLVAGSKWIYEFEGGQSRTVGNSYVHPDCGDSGEHSFLRHNVGVFEARQNFFTTPNLKSISLWSDSGGGWDSQLTYLQKKEVKCSLAGWGKTEDKNYSEWLLVAHVKIVPEEKCIEQFCRISGPLCKYLAVNFHVEGKLCVANVGAAHPCDAATGNNDVGSALYCNDYVYGILSRTYDCSRGGMSIFDSVRWSIDLYRTVQLEAAATSLTSLRRFVTAAIVLLNAAVSASYK